MTHRESRHRSQRSNESLAHHDGGGAGGPGGSARSSHRTPLRGAGEIALRGPAQLADALPYLLGFYPDDSIVVVALHGDRRRFGGRIRLGLPGDSGEWPAVSAQVAACLEENVKSGGRRPEGAIVYLCQDPSGSESGREVMERLRPLAQALRTACGEREMPVYEALCLSGGSFWSYCCPDAACCPAEGRPMAVPGTSAMAAAAAYAGIQVHGSLRELERRLAALGPKAAEVQERALDDASRLLVPRILAPSTRRAVEAETLVLAERLLTRFRTDVPAGKDIVTADTHDDRLMSHEEAALLILGLQDRRTRDRAAEWMEGGDVGPALRLWRALARRCVGPYTEHSAAPLTLAGWVAWSGGDEATARVALDRALRSDPEYSFARLLHRAFNDGMDPELLRRCMRKEREARKALKTQVPPQGAPRSAP
ncbi:DUF4192 domain-containing protein [Streptomyces ovatisporus]|uniref:DUF4192 domain-containing protein n=1 Tax=Streptomyces ovatisporus TaxID=1128682 RepID=A0ABV9AFM1_9ACTN